MLERFPPYPGLADSVKRSGNGIGVCLCADGEPMAVGGYRVGVGPSRAKR